MITLITGAPGTGKSAALVSLLQELAKDRAIYVSGIPDLAIDHHPLEDPSKWIDDVPDGSIVVIDEVQRVWRPRGPGQKVPADIAALETHRHRGIDFYVVTQAPRLVDTNVRALVGRHVHLRDLGFLGRWWYEWPECAENCATGWKNAPIKKRYRLPRAIFSQYRSASMHMKPVRSFPFMVVVMLAALLVCGVLAWRFYGIVSSKLNPVPMTSAMVGAKPATPAGVMAGPPAGAPGAQPEAFIDDRMAWIPRISSRPESAPAFDKLRQVVAMPVVVGAICNAKGCRCVTQQGTHAGLSEQECRRWMENPPFDAYSAPQARQGPTPALAQQNAPAARSDGPALVILDGPGFRDPLRGGTSSIVGGGR